jgi:hypothetical protein
MFVDVGRDKDKEPADEDEEDEDDDEDEEDEEASDAQMLGCLKTRFSGLRSRWATRCACICAVPDKA